MIFYRFVTSNMVVTFYRSADLGRYHVALDLIHRNKSNIIELSAFNLPAGVCQRRVQWRSMARDRVPLEVRNHPVFQPGGDLGAQGVKAKNGSWSYFVLPHVTVVRRTPAMPVARLAKRPATLQLGAISWLMLALMMTPFLG